MFEMDFGVAERKSLLELEQEIMAKQKQFRARFASILALMVLLVFFLGFIAYYFRDQMALCSFFLFFSLMGFFAILSSKKDYVNVLNKYEDIIYNIDVILDGEYKGEK